MIDEKERRKGADDLALAIVEGSLEDVQTCLRRGADPNLAADGSSRERWRWPQALESQPLALALEMGGLKEQVGAKVLALLEAGASVESASALGYKALFIAIGRQPEMAWELMRRGARRQSGGPGFPRSEAALIASVESGRWDLFEALAQEELEEGAKRDLAGRSVAQVAARGHDDEFFAKFLARGDWEKWGSREASVEDKERHPEKAFQEMRESLREMGKRDSRKERWELRERWLMAAEALRKEGAKRDLRALWERVQSEGTDPVMEAAQTLAGAEKRAREWMGSAEQTEKERARGWLEFALRTHPGWEKNAHEARRLAEAVEKAGDERWKEIFRAQQEAKELDQEALAAGGEKKRAREYRL